MPGQVWGLAVNDSTGPIFVTSYAGRDLDATMLTAVDPAGQARTMFTQDNDRAVMSRILLLERGRVVFSLHDELLLFRSTGLAPLDNGPWPCGDGNLHGNPVRA